MKHFQEEILLLKRRALLLTRGGRFGWLSYLDEMMETLGCLVGAEKWLITIQQIKEYVGRRL